MGRIRREDPLMQDTQWAVRMFQLSAGAHNMLLWCHLELPRNGGHWRESQFCGLYRRRVEALRQSPRTRMGCLRQRRNNV